MKKYYLHNYPRTDFYLLGKKDESGKFEEGHGLKFIKEYLREYPYLLLEMSVDLCNSHGFCRNINFIKFLNNETKR